MGGEAHAGMAIGAENILAKVDAALQLSCDLVDSFIYAGAPIQDLGFGTWLENLLQWQNLGLLDKIGTFLGPFWDLSGTFCRYFDDTTAKQYRRLKRHIVATFSAKSGLFENHFRTFTGNLDYILKNIWRKCLIRYLMLVDIQTTSSQTFSFSGHQEGQHVDYILAILSFIEIKLKFHF